MVPRSAIVLLAFLVFVGACASEQIAQEGTEEQRQVEANWNRRSQRQVLR